MQEYIIYAILIFFPIGILMDFLLRRQGLILKYRLVIITTSLAIIISFPIFMGKMGLPIALVLYFSAIIALTWFFIRVTQSHAWYLRQQGVSVDEEVYVSDRLIDLTKVQTVGDIEDAMWSKESDRLAMNSSSDTLYPHTSINENTDEKTEITQDNDSLPPIEITDRELLSREINFIQNVKDSDIQQETGIEESLISDKLEFDSIVEEPIAESSIIKVEEPEVSADHEADEQIESIIDQFELQNVNSLETGNFKNQIDFHDENILIPEKEIAAIVEPETIADDLSTRQELDYKPKNEFIPAESEAAADLNETAVVESELESNDNKKEIKIEEHTIETSDNIVDASLTMDEDRMNELINQAFEFKNDQRLMEALDYFSKALNISSNEDLSFLLLMEMVNIYKDLGMYAKAEELLFLSIGKAHRRTDIIDEIERQLSYIRLLSFELDRLGLANTPISEVPRLVRMNVAEIVEI